MGKRTVITDEEVVAIQGRRRENSDKQIEKWLKILVLHAEGKSRKQIAEICECGTTYVGELVCEYKRVGLEAFARKCYKKNTPQNMSFEEEAALLEKYRKEAEEGKIVEISAIKAEYEEKVGHKIGSGQIYFVLKRHKWRKVKPRNKHPKKATEEVIDTSKKLTLEWRK